MAGVTVEGEESLLWYASGGLKTHATWRVVSAPGSSGHVLETHGKEGNESLRVDLPERHAFFFCGPTLTNDVSPDDP